MYTVMPEGIRVAVFFTKLQRRLLEPSSLQTGHLLPSRVVRATSSSAEALLRANETRPDVVLVDIALGSESGFDLARA
jgi:CheY-like chemotaxis protein